MPSPGTLFTLISMPCRSAMRLAMARPKPEPAVSFTADMNTEDAKRLKALEKENARLKQLVAE